MVIENIILALIPVILIIVFMVFICVVVGGGLDLICRPLGHQYE